MNSPLKDKNQLEITKTVHEQDPQVKLHNNLLKKSHHEKNSSNKINKDRLASAFVKKQQINPN
jgi:hypothetical protein